MKILFTWVFGFAHFTSGSFSENLVDLSSRYNATSWSIEDRLVLDIAQQARSNYNVVLLSGLQARISLNGFPRNGSNMSSSPITNLQPNSLTTQTLEDLKVLNVKVNRNSFYILLIDDKPNKVINLVKKIQSVDHQSQVAIIYKIKIDVVGIFKKLEIYNIFMFVKDNYEADDS